MSATDLRSRLARGLAIPACPLALNRQRQWDVRRQRALFRYYAAAGAGGLAVGVHTTQFAIREPRHGLFQPLLDLAAEEMDRADETSGQGLARIGGICGRTKQAVHEASLLRERRYEAGLLSLAAMRDASEDQVIEHCRVVAGIIPLVGFYLQPQVGGRILPFSFWRRFAEIPAVVAIKIAPFNRYQTLDVVRAVAESGRTDVALYTGNDDQIVVDLLTPFSFSTDAGAVERRIVGGLLGQWAVWTKPAVGLLTECQRVVKSGVSIPPALLRRGVEWTDVNAAVFDVANGFAGCIAGVHEILRRQGVLEGIWCLDPDEGLGAGQAAEIDRVYRTYPDLNDDAFVRENLDRWLKE